MVKISIFGRYTKKNSLTPNISHMLLSLNRYYVVNAMVSPSPYPEQHLMLHDPPILSFCTLKTTKVAM